MHRRAELEGPATRSLIPAEWPPSAARSLVLELCGDAPLEERLTIRQLRRKRRLVSGVAIVELSLDEVDVLLACRGGRPVRGARGRARRGHRDGPRAPARDPRPRARPRGVPRFQAPGGGRCDRATHRSPRSLARTGGRRRGRCRGGLRDAAPAGRQPDSRRRSGRSRPTMGNRRGSVPSRTADEHELEECNDRRGVRRGRPRADRRGALGRPCRGADGRRRLSSRPRPSRR